MITDSFYFFFNRFGLSCDEIRIEAATSGSKMADFGPRNQDRFRSNFDHFRSNFEEKSDRKYSTSSDFFVSKFELDESDLLATLNSLAIGDENPTPLPPPPPPLGLEKLQRSFLNGSKASRGSKIGSGNKRSIFRRLPSLTLLNFSSQPDSWYTHETFPLKFFPKYQNLASLEVPRL